MNEINSFTFTHTHSDTHTFTISSTNTNTHTNKPYIEIEAYKGLASKHCQKKQDENLNFQVDFIQQMIPSTLPGGLFLPGRNP